ARGENCGWGATLATSLTTGRRPSNASSRYLPLLSTQCAAVSTRSAAIATPVHRLCSPTISTTWRAIARSAKGPPPTMAAAGAAGGEWRWGGGRGLGGRRAQRARGPARCCVVLKEEAGRPVGGRWSCWIAAKAGHNAPPFERIVRWSPRHCRDVLWGSRSLLG